MPGSTRRCAAALAALAMHALVGGSTPAFGQTVQFTAIPGVSIAHLNYPDSATGAKPRLGAALHVAAEIRLTRTMALRLGAAMVDRGSRAENEYVDLRYVEVPVQLRYQGPERDRTVPWLALGISSALPVQCRASTMTFVPGGAFAGYWRRPIACAGAYDRTDVGVTASVGLKGSPARLSWITELRYTHGTANLAGAGQPRVRTRTVTFGIGASWTPRGPSR